jgi:UDP-N-acetylmuramate dehydrogenase
VPGHLAKVSGVLRNLSYIPGEVGAAAVQNIGAYGVEAKDIIRTVHAFDIEKGTFVDFDASECEYGYRESHFKHVRDRYIITHVDFVLSAIARPRLDYSKALGCLAGKPGLTPLDVREAVIVIRKQKLPEVGLVGSAGSFFKNPVVSRDVYEAVVRIAAAEAASGTSGTATAATTTGVVPHYDAGGGLVKIPAAWLIEQCGWRGHRCGNAGVWDMQPLVLINATGNALPEEIVALEDKIRASVKQRFGIDLECEVEHL